MAKCVISASLNGHLVCIKSNDRRAILLPVFYAIFISHILYSEQECRTFPLCTCFLMGIFHMKGQTQPRITCMQMIITGAAAKPLSQGLWIMWDGIGVGVGWMVLSRDTFSTFRRWWNDSNLSWFLSPSGPASNSLLEKDMEFRFVSSK